MNVTSNYPDRPEEEPVLVDSVVSDPAWIARRDQALRELQRSMLWTYGGTAETSAMARRQGERS